MLALRDGPLAKAWREAGWTVRALAFRKPLVPAQVDRLAARLAEALAACGAELVLVNGVRAFAGVDAARRAGAHAVWVIREPGPEALADLSRTVRARALALLSQADEVVFVSQATRAAWAPWIKQARTWVIDNALPPVAKVAPAMLGRGPGERVILAAGPLCPRKAPLDLLAAWALLPDDLAATGAVALGRSRQRGLWRAGARGLGAPARGPAGRGSRFWTNAPPWRRCGPGPTWPSVPAGPRLRRAWCWRRSAPACRWWRRRSAAFRRRRRAGRQAGWCRRGIRRRWHARWRRPCGRHVRPRPSDTAARFEALLERLRGGSARRGGRRVIPRPDESSAIGASHPAPPPGGGRLGGGRGVSAIPCLCARQPHPNPPLSRGGSPDGTLRRKSVPHKRRLLLEGTP